MWSFYENRKKQPMQINICIYECKALKSWESCKVNVKYKSMICYEMWFDLRQLEMSCYRRKIL